MRVVIDTNVIISYFLNRDSVPGRAARKAVALGTPVLTQATLGELIAVLYRDKFDPYATPESRKAFLRSIVGAAEIAAVPRPIVACRDPNDDKFLEAAAFGDADYLVTGDNDLLTMRRFMDTEIVSPTDFLALTQKP